jgi:3-oxoacyl-[acyl-carrier-protein] synthase II
VSIGSGIGGLPMIEETHLAYLNGGLRKVSPFFVPGTIINMISGLLSIHYGYKGPNLATVTACSTANHSIGEAARLIEYGDADVMVAGGAESTVSPLGIGGFIAARALSHRNDDPATASRPWDKDRDGFVLGEGAGVIVLEELEHAKARGATHLLRADRLRDVGRRAPHHRAAGRRRRRAAQHAQRAQNARMAPTDIDYINAHGTSTPIGDLAECTAVERAFGEHAHKLAVSSTKSMTGHLLGAAGGIEAVFTVLAIRDQVAPPTANLFHQDPACRPRLRAAARAQDAHPRRAVQLVRLRRHQRHAGLPRHLGGDGADRPEVRRHVGRLDRSHQERREARRALARAGAPARSSSCPR